MVICRKKGCKREVEDYKTKRGKPPTLCLGHYEIQRRNEEKRKQRAKEEKKDENTCRIRNCKENIGNYETKSGKKPTMCKHHYDLQNIREERRPERNRDYTEYEKERSKRPERIVYKKEYVRSSKFKLITYKNKSNRISGKRTWELTDDFAISLFLGECKYCKRQGVEGKSNGIDRIDNNIHYIESNCVSCCYTCNHMKGTLSHDDFINHIRNIKRVTIDNLEPIVYDIKEDTNEQNYRQTVKCKLSVRKSDIKRNHIKKCELSDEIVIKLFLGNCRYCKKKSIEGKHLNGIDRVDNNIHYIESNCVSCCWTCNHMKETKTHDDFLENIQGILQNF